VDPDGVSFPTGLYLSAVASLPVLGLAGQPASVFLKSASGLKTQDVKFEASGPAGPVQGRQGVARGLGEEGARGAARPCTNGPGKRASADEPEGRKPHAINGPTPRRAPRA
jgi:hypothetical protein